MQTTINTIHLRALPYICRPPFAKHDYAKLTDKAMLFNYSTAKPLAEVRHTLWYGEKCCILMQVAASLWNAGGVNKGHVISEVLLRETAFCLRAQRPTKVHQVFSHSGLLPARRTGCNVFDNPRLLIKQTKNKIIIHAFNSKRSTRARQAFSSFSDVCNCDSKRVHLSIARVNSHSAAASSDLVLDSPWIDRGCAISCFLL